MPNVLAVERLDHHLNPLPWPRFLSVADEGDGVMETFDAICQRVYDALSLPAPPPGGSSERL